MARVQNTFALFTFHALLLFNLQLAFVPSFVLTPLQAVGSAPARLLRDSVAATPKGGVARTSGCTLAGGTTQVLS